VSFCCLPVPLLRLSAIIRTVVSTTRTIILIFPAGIPTARTAVRVTRQRQSDDRYCSIASIVLRRTATSFLTRRFRTVGSEYTCIVHPMLHGTSDVASDVTLHPMLHGASAATHCIRSVECCMLHVARCSLTPQSARGGAAPRGPRWVPREYPVSTRGSTIDSRESGASNCRRVHSSRSHSKAVATSFDPSRTVSKAYLQNDDTATMWCTTVHRHCGEGTRA
jgi:hypothetical protein